MTANEPDRCTGVTAVGPCGKAARFGVIGATATPTGATERHARACGLHLPQIVRYLIEEHDRVTVTRMETR